MIYPSTLSFLSLLKQNNNREWFGTHKEEFLVEQAHVIAFADKVLDNLNRHDVIETPSGRRSIYRIYRDIRFSKDKTPFQTYWGGGFKRASRYRRGGYYFHLEQGNSLLAGGFWGPNPADLKRIRADFELDPAPFRSMITHSDFISNFGELKGEKLKTAPRGYYVDHPSIDLLTYKQFLVIKKFTDEEVLSENFVEQVDQTYRAMRPFFDYMSELLSTDKNGESLL